MSTLPVIGLANALAAALLAVPAFLVSRRGKRPALAHALWLLVLLKLVTPPLLRPSLPWLPTSESSRVAQTERPVDVVALAEPALVDSHAEISPPMINLVVPTEVALVGEKNTARITDTVALPASTPIPEPPPPEMHDTDILNLVILVWFTGVVFLLSRTLFLAVRFHHLLAHARLAPDAIQFQLRELAARMGMANPPQLWLVPGAVPPMVWGLGCVRILFPTGLLDRLGESQRASLLAHELAHVRRGDHWVRWLELIVLALFWWYPLAWWARKQLQDREEECCDAWVTSLVPAHIYAGAILDTVDYLSESSPRIPALASPLGQMHSLKDRLVMIMTGQVSGQLSAASRFLLVALAAAVLPLLPTLVQASDQPSTSDPPVRIELSRENPPLTEVQSNPTDLLATVDDIFSVTFSPNGKFIATGCGTYDQPGEVELYDVDSRKRLWGKRAVRGISSINFNPAGNRLLYSSWSSFAHVMDLQTRAEIFTLRPSARNVRVRYSPDNRFLAAATEDAKIGLYQPTTGKFLGDLVGEKTDFYSLEFSRDSRFLAAGGGRFQNGAANPVFVWDMTNRKQIAKLQGHTLAVIGIAFAPKNELIATAAADKTVRIWDGKTYKLRNILNGHTAGVRGVTFSPDGKLLATGSWDRTIRLWDPFTAKQIGVLEGHPGVVREIAFSPDGKFLVSGGGLRSLKLWDVLNRKELATLHEEKPATAPRPAHLAMAVSRDGELVALGQDNGAVILREARSGDIRFTLRGHEDAVTALAFSRDGKWLASGGPDTAIHLWNLTTGKSERTLKGHTSWIYSLDFSHSGKWLASGSYDKTIRLWSLKEKTEPKVLNGHRASVRRVVFSPDDRLLASGGADRKVRLWDVAKAELLHTMTGHNGAIRALDFSFDGKTLASGGEDLDLRVWDPATGNQRRLIKMQSNEIHSLAFAPRTNMIVTGHSSGNLLFWDPTTGTNVTRTRFGHNQGVMEIVFSGDGRRMFTLGGDQRLKVWHMTPGAVQRFVGHTGPVLVATFSKDGKEVLSCSGWPEGDKTLRLWEAKSGKQLRRYEGNMNPFQSAAFSPDGKYVLGGETTGIITVWEKDSGKLIRQFRGHKASVVQILFSSDGKQMLTACNDKTARLWDWEKGTTIHILSGHTEWVRCVGFLPDGKRLITGSRDKTLRLWDRETGKLLKSIDHQGAIAQTLAILPDGNRVVTGSGMNVSIWDIEEGKLLRTFKAHTQTITQLAVDPAGKTALTCAYDNQAHWWDLETGNELWRTESHQNWVWSVAFSPDATMALTAGGGRGDAKKATAGSDHVIRMWRLPRTESR